MNDDSTLSDNVIVISETLSQLLEIFEPDFEPSGKAYQNEKMVFKRWSQKLSSTVHRKELSVLLHLLRSQKVIFIT